MKPEDIKVGTLYRGHRRRHIGNGRYDDRIVTWVSTETNQVQYDSYAISFGRRLPVMSLDQFARWAKEEMHDEG